MQLSSDLSFVKDLARGAGKVVLDNFGKVERLTKTHAATTDEAVTEADRAAQRFIVEGLRKRFPNDGIIGEESDTGDSITCDCPDPLGRVWVIDPIDGTNNFIAGYGAFAVCIGLLEKGDAVLGVVYDVTRDEMYAAARGEGAWLNDRQIHAVQTPLGDSSLLMLTSNLLDKAGRCPGWPKKLLDQTKWKVRVLGSAAMEAVQVASGVAHGAVTINGKIWDAAAPNAIVLAAGGKVTDLSGKPLFPFDLRNYAGAKVPFIAAAPNALQEFLDLVRLNP